MELNRSPVLALLAFTLLSLVGCGGTTRTMDQDFPRAGDWFDGAPGAIAVLPGDDTPFFSLSALKSQTDNTPVSGGANTVSAECGANALPGCTDGVLAAPLDSLVESAVGAETTGDWSAYGIASLTRAGEQLKHSVADRRPHLLVSHAVVSRIRARTKYDAQLKSFRGHPEEFVPEGPFNGLVEIGLTKVGLVVNGPLDESVEDPRVALEIGVSASVYAMRERQFVREARGGWEYLGPSRRLSELVAENGRLLNEEIERAAKTLAKRIVK